MNGELEWIWKEAVVPESHSIRAFTWREWKNENPSSGKVVSWSRSEPNAFRSEEHKRKNNVFSIDKRTWQKKRILILFRKRVNATGGPGNLVDIATDYGLEGPGSNPGGDEIFPPVQTGPGAHPAPCTMGTGSFPGVEAAGAWG